MQQTEKTAAEAEAERNRGLGLVFVESKLGVTVPVYSPSGAIS
jgi:hypothetical protein